SLPCYSDEGTLTRKPAGHLHHSPNNQRLLYTLDVGFRSRQDRICGRPTGKGMSFGNSRKCEDARTTRETLRPLSEGLAPHRAFISAPSKSLSHKLKMVSGQPTRS